MAINKHIFFQLGVLGASLEWWQECSLRYNPLLFFPMEVIG